ncbi:MAG: RNA-binding domain-containing protein [Candidatus Methanofastidiosia archaeon]|jgi:predicted RNA binding protein with dsRBD fold (UPF0201 family)
MSNSITVSVVVHFTESESKVNKALKNIFPALEFTPSEKGFTATSDDLKSLAHLKELLKSQKIRSTANYILKNSLLDNELVFYLNKQAAYMGKVNFSENCPLDPITVNITGNNLYDIIDSLSPITPER